MSDARLPPRSSIVPQVPLAHAARARTLVERQRNGVLCTLLAPRQGPVGEGQDDTGEVAGYPFGSMVSYALDDDGAPLLLTSSLAEHTRSFVADPRVSLFVSETESDGDVLAMGRVTLLGAMERADGAETRARYLARHPQAAAYAAFNDFTIWRLRIQAIRYIEGFGRMSWIEASAYAAAKPSDAALSMGKEAEET